ALPAGDDARDLLDRLDELDVRVGAQTELPQPLQHREVRARARAVTAGTRPVDPHRERPFGSDGGVELAERPCGRVARVRRGLLSSRNLKLVEAPEPRERKVHLAAD